MIHARQCLWSRVVAVMLLVALLASCAQPPTPTNGTERAEWLTRYFDKADANSNDVIETAEINAEINADFDALDYNDEGAVTIEDIYNEEQGLPEGVEPVLDLSHHLPHDLNSDGAITREEYRSYLESELLEEMDSSGDGQISFEEYRAFNEF